ncbi:iron-containing alcohol dehydrogenase [Alteromonas sp. ASW11-36]|uniref:Iron-containing alcohol dehydrogenase n=1 Tax=Alteromonas arenosi TaxID=3055817 RepID=A0ABT7SWX7_9ALTE|nr:iron-containing alcohol dehydrogenase [Alteromonas sp. ASW11-36]MDM7860057.1 iron-containing alcohol dehydrogenase [Alteromonas sp. ASW11-36]
MRNFSFHNPTMVQFGKGSISKLTKMLSPKDKILMLYGGGSIKQNGVYQQVLDATADLDIVEFGGIEANPEYSTLMRAVELAREEKISFILAVGGGSVIDGSKFVAAAIPFEGDAWNILNGSTVKTAVPLGCILTLPATGSETNTAAVVNRSEQKLKKAFASPKVQPQFAILDPEVTYSLPTRQLINGVIDPFVHVIEQYLTYPIGASVQDRFAESILINLIEIGKDAIADVDYDKRANLMWNATQALNGLIGAGVPQDWSTHMIGHELTAAYGLDHAATLAIVLPRLMDAKRKNKHAKLLQYAERVWNIDTSDESAAIDQVISKTEDFFRDLGMRTKLSEYDIGEEAADVVKQGLITNGYLKLGEHQDITPDDAARIITASV